MKGRDTSRTTSIQDPSMAKKKLTATNPYNGLIARWLFREGTDARTAGEGTLRSRGRFFSHRFFPFLPFSTLAQRRSRSTFSLSAPSSVRSLLRFAPSPSLMMNASIFVSWCVRRGRGGMVVVDKVRRIEIIRSVALAVFKSKSRCHPSCRNLQATNLALFNGLRDLLVDL